MKVKSESEVAQLCPTLSDPMDCSLPVRGISQARELEWGAIAFVVHELRVFLILLFYLFQNRQYMHLEK